MPSSVEKLGRLLVDDEGLEQRPMLGLFGEAFRIRWSELTRWWVVDQCLLDRRTGSERVVGHVLGLEYRGTAQITSHTSTGFRRIVDAIRRHAADKEISGDDSPLVQVIRDRP